MEISLPFDSSEQTMDLIKLAALYYDKVNVVFPEVLENVSNNLPYFNHEFLLSIKTLWENGVATVKAFVPAYDPKLSDVLMDDFLSAEMAEMFRARGNKDDGLLQQTINDMQLIDGYRNIECTKVLSKFYNSNSYPGYQMVAFEYCYSLLNILYTLFCNRQNCVSSSERLGQWLNQMLQQWLQMLQQSSDNSKRFKGISHDLTTALDTTPILLPNYSSLDYEDILEMRLKAGDELQELRCYLGELSSKYDAEDKQLTTAKDFIERDIRRAINQFESKAKGLRKETIQRALKSMANPLSYAPMLTTFIKEVPLWVSTGLSMGIITADAALEYSRQKDKLKDDPLYFTVKLNKYGKGKR